MKAALNLRKVLSFRVLTEQNGPEASHKGGSPISKDPTSHHHTGRDCVSKREGGEACVPMPASATFALSPHTVPTEIMLQVPMEEPSKLLLVSFCFTPPLPFQNFLEFSRSKLLTVSSSGFPTEIVV